MFMRTINLATYSIVTGYLKVCFHLLHRWWVCQSRLVCAPWALAWAHQYLGPLHELAT